MKVLVAEDDDAIRVVIQLCLEKLGGDTVISVSRAAEAIERVRHESFDLCLLDRWLPDADGFQLAGQLRLLRPALPIIFLSADEEIDDLDRGRSLARGVIRKPFEPTELVARIRRIMGDAA